MRLIYTPTIVVEIIEMIIITWTWLPPGYTFTNQKVLIFSYFSTKVNIYVVGTY